MGVVHNWASWGVSIMKNKPFDNKHVVYNSTPFSCKPWRMDVYPHIFVLPCKPLCRHALVSARTPATRGGGNRTRSALKVRMTHT